MIHHDNTLDRCTDGSGNLWDYTVDELERLDAGSHFSAEYVGERIPRLTALLQCCREQKLGLNLEVKHVTLRSPDVPTASEQAMEERLAHVVCDTIEQCGVLPSELVFSSFSRPAIAVLRSRLPHFQCAFLVKKIPDDWFDFMIRHDCVSLNFHWNEEENTRERIQECARNVLCYSYTVNDPTVAQRLLSWGVSGVFSDCPNIISEALRAGDGGAAPSVYLPLAPLVLASSELEPITGLVEPVTGLTAAAAV